MRPAFRLYARVFRGLRVDVVGLIQNPSGEVLLGTDRQAISLTLIRCGLPRNGDPEKVLARELGERGGIDLLARPKFLMILKSRTAQTDHVLVYRVCDWRYRPGSEAQAAEASWWTSSDPLPHAVRSETRDILQAAGFQVGASSMA